MLADAHGRRIDYLRLSVTDRCDLRCAYCMPQRHREFVEPAGWLRFAEMERIVSVFAAMGVRRVRLTGGEPLLRRDLPALAARIAAVPGIEDLSLSTNGTRLAGNALALRTAGVRRLNVSLDSLRRERVRALCSRDVLEHVLEGLEAARGADFELVKINMVALADTDEAEIDQMVGYCIERGFVLRLIETMPVGAAGRAAPFVDLQPVRERLRRRFGLVDGVVPGAGPARYLVSPDGRFRIGFITALSQHFCATCNRVRLTVDGALHLCLGQDDRVDLRALLRAGASDTQVAEAVRVGLMRKPERHEFHQRPGRILRLMSATGG